jgi:hypothetical protein
LRHWGQIQRQHAHAEVFSTASLLVALVTII